MTKFNTAFFLAATASASGGVNCNSFNKKEKQCKKDEQCSWDDATKTCNPKPTLGVCMNHGERTSIDCEKSGYHTKSDTLFVVKDGDVPYEDVAYDCFQAAKDANFFVGDEERQWRYVAIGHYKGEVQCKMYTKMKDGPDRDRITVNPMTCKPESEDGPTVSGGRSWAITTSAECDTAKQTAMCQEVGCSWETFAAAAHALKKSKAVIV